MHDDESGKQSPSGRSRLEDEVLEILVRADQPASFKDHVRRRASRQRRARFEQLASGLPGLGAAIGPGALLIGSLALAFIAAAVRDGSALFAQVLAVCSVALLLAIYALSRGGARRSNAKQWRGQDIDLSPPPPAWVSSLRERFRRPPRR